MSWQGPPPQEEETEEQESTSAEGRGLPDGWQAGARSASEQERETVSPPSSFDYDQLDAETRQFALKKAIETHGLLGRTAEHITAIGSNLLAVKERLPHGQFGEWLRAEFGLSRTTAFRFMRVASQLGDKCFSLKHLPAQVLYELASPSFPPALVEQVKRGEVDPTLGALTQAKMAYKHAQATEQMDRLHAQEAGQAILVGEQEVQAARLRAQEAEKKIEDLTGHIEELHQQIAQREGQAREPRFIEKPVVPPQMQADLERLQKLVGDLTRERERLIERVEQLGAHNRAEFIERNEVARHQRVRQQWCSVAAAWERSTRELSSHWPTLLDSESFGQEEWATLHHLKDAASSMAGRCEKLVQARQMIVDSRL